MHGQPPVQLRSSIPARHCRIIAHRGLHATVPENTLAAFLAAAREGIGGAELDLRQTADGRFLVNHNTRLPGSRTPIADRSEGAWVRAYPKVATLTALLAAVPATLHLYLEVKDADAPVASLVETLRVHGAWGRSTIISFHPGVLRSLGSAPVDRWLLVGVHPWHRLRYPSITFNACRVASALGCSAVAPRATMVGQRLMAEARRLRLAVVPWTVDRPEVAQSLLHRGVAGFITDAPLLLRSVLGPVVG